MIYTIEDFNYAAIKAIHAMFSPSLFGTAFSLADKHPANRFAEDTRRKIQYGRLIFCSGTNMNTYCFLISKVSVS